MEVSIKNISRTSLQEEPLIKLVKNYCHDMKYDICISFDLRLKDYGSYNYKKNKKKHIIKISPTLCKNANGNNILLDKNAEIYQLIATLLHELRHSMQKEKRGEGFWTAGYCCVSEIKNMAASDFFSKREVDARIFENKNILKAVDFYNNACKT